MTPSSSSLGIIRVGTLIVFGAVKSTQLSAIPPVNKDLMNTTCSADMPDPIITLVVDALSPNRIAADKAKRTPSVGFL
jgi:hypothetical protein